MMRLTWDELRRRYPQQWVMLVELDWVNDQLAAAVVVSSGAQRSAALANGLAALATERPFACFFTGPTRAPALRFGSPRYDETSPLFVAR